MVTTVKVEKCRPNEVPLTYTDIVITSDKAEFYNGKLKVGEIRAYSIFDSARGDCLRISGLKGELLVNFA